MTFQIRHNSCSKGVQYLLFVGLFLLIVINTTLATTVSEGKCIQFDGVDDVVNAGDINAIDSAQQLTAEMWVRIDKFDAWRTFFGKVHKLANRIQFQQFSEPGKIAVCVNNNADIEKEGNQAYFYTPGPEVTIGDWFHLAMVFDGTLSENERLKLYINGMVRTLKKDGAAKGAIPTHLPSTNAPLLLGAEKANGTYGFKGLMDEIRIWNTARTSDEIRTNMDQQLTGNENGLLLYYTVDKASDSAGVMIDYSKNKTNAKMVNFDMKNCFIDRDVAIPALASSEIKTGEISANNIRMAWVRGSGAVNLVFATDRETGLPQPENGVTYIGNPEYGKGTRIGESYWFCVYNGYEADMSVTGLTPSSEYRFSVVDYNGAPGSERYKIDSTSIMTITTSAPVAVKESVTQETKKQNQEITFILDSISTEGSAPIILGATSNSALPIAYLTSDTSIAKIKDNNLLILSSGSVIITASQPGNESWLPAEDKSRILIVNKAPPVPKPVSAPVKETVSSKKPKILLISGVAVFGAGAVLGIIALIAGGNDGDGGGTPNATDRPPRDPVIATHP
jgi:hypothetical protein